jgi:hypothetical protein
MTSNLHALNPESAAWLSETFARNRAAFGGWFMEGDGGDGGDSGSGDGSSGDAGADKGDKGADKAETFTQADVDRIVKERVKRAEAKFADYGELKAKAEGAKTAEEQIADLQKKIQATEHEVLRRRVQAKHGISDEDASLLLTATDEDTLTAQAKRLAERESDRKKQGNRVAGEGRNHAAKSDDGRETVRSLFGNGG